MIEDKVFKKWEETGFLYDLDDDLSRVVAFEFEKMYKFLSLHRQTDDLLATVVFPIIRKIITESDIREINCTEILRLWDKEFTELMHITIANENAEMDLIGEACYCVTKEYIKLHE